MEEEVDICLWTLPSSSGQDSHPPRWNSGRLVFSPLFCCGSVEWGWWKDRCPRGSEVAEAVGWRSGFPKLRSTTVTLKTNKQTKNKIVWPLKWPTTPMTCSCWHLMGTVVLQIWPVDTVTDITWIWKTKVCLFFLCVCNCKLYTN